jgi:ParB family chromosome partitioning protein
MAKQPKMNLKAFAGIVQDATQSGGDATVPIDLIDVERQVRTKFDPERQASMNASIKAQGIIQSLVFLAKPDGRYRLIAGEYRYRGALANELKEVPAKIRHNLTESEIRRIQVSENLERTDITAFDEAMGVAEDVEKFGFTEAMAIWNRSEGWISKRASVLKYAEPVRKLLEEGICNDLEVAHPLNQIYGLDQQEFLRLEKRLREGVPLSREEARGKVQQVKEWTAESKQRAERRETLSHQKPAAKAPAGSAHPQTGTAHAPKAHQGPATVAKAPGAAPASAPAPATHATATTSPGNSADPAAAEGKTELRAANQVTQEQAVVLEQMVTLFQNGLANHTLVKAVQDELVAIGADMNQSEWAMWSLYQTTLLPLLSALGESRAQRYLQRTLADLRSTTSQELWNRLHPPVDGKASDDWTTEREPVARMPENWRF